ncbi:MAG: arylformamidase [Polaribacter sp.]|jgi:arylformamidase
MKYIDLTHVFDEKISIYPGGKAPIVKQINNVNDNGFASKQLSFTSHQGTHIDGMAHMEANGKTLNEIDLEQFEGKAIAIDVRSFAGRQIPVEVFKKMETIVQKADFILLFTGWSALWGKKEYEEDFPTMTNEATAYLCKQNIKGVGMDCFSPDPVNSPDYANHHIAFGQEVLLIENLTNLELLPLDELFEFQCFPMKIIEADGAPVRAIAKVNVY